MWPFKKKSILGAAVVLGQEKVKLSYGSAAAIIISIIGLCVSAGVFRWSWLILDEQITLRKEFMELKNGQEQLQLQADFWLGQLQKKNQELDINAPQQ